MGSGFRTFAASEVLTSSNVQNYLMDQAVTVHGSTAILGTAIASPEAGMVAYVDSGDSSEGLYVYHGSAWRKGPGWNAPWGVMAVHKLTTSQATTGTHTTYQASGLTTTFNAIQNRYLKITSMTAPYANGGANGYAINHFVNGVGASGGGVASLSTSLSGSFTFTSYYITLATASITIAVYQAASPNNTAITDFANAANPRILIVEDIGPSGAPV